METLEKVIAVWEDPNTISINEDLLDSFLHYIHIGYIEEKAIKVEWADSIPFIGYVNRSYSLLTSTGKKVFKYI